MRIKSLMKNKKAFSAIIAALILMLIAVAAGVVVYAYVMGWIGGVQTNPAGQGIIVIDSIDAVDTETAIVYVRNAGTIPVTVSAIYIDGSLSPSPSPSAAGGLTIPVGIVEAITVTDVFSAGQSYLFKVVCIDGTTVSGTLVTPTTLEEA
ncbi:MAG: hypothetical protein IAX22_03095 [Candidatus Bathyarchaeota archaeon]|nr:hypothetical protein [Candidatus Bathyarchaeota archaeon]